MNLLFLCTGNACRSQMAEGWAKQLAPGDWRIESAGIEAHGKNPRAIAVMAEAGVDISQQESTRLTPEMLERADYLVTVCGHADEQCPALPAGTRKAHWPLADPARASGSEEAVMNVFRETRETIRHQVHDLVQRLQEQNQ
ncbi:arsenate reductase (thioredoxin) [Thiohalophilus thiocyanatoxydans]|uniref:Arsenate reductase n=1 Tax=Thiohalophilus thiocyanatoxydans TaxID=381308 RepID=A0A4V3H423_9GAMM|nr:arsenate reductase (thioredoxin) [Thiohalophilus thiocyanatoxydans]TDY01575.1 arsenate reductase [Thiohalophilus thiocyanatoxydans]